MSLLNRKLFRDMLAHKAQVIAVLIIVALGTSIFIGLAIIPRSLDTWLGRIFASTRYEDFKVQVRGAPAAKVRDLASLDNIVAMQPTIERDVTALVNGSEMTVRVISIPDEGTASVNGIMLESGVYPSLGSGGAVAERHLANQFGLKPGDGLKLLVAGREVPVTVSGSATSPRFLRLVADQATLMSDPSQFGVLFMRQSDLEKVFGTSPYTMFAFRVKDQARLNATMRSAITRLTPYSVVGANTGAEEQSTRLMKMDLKNMKNISFFFVLIFLYVSAMAIYIVLARVIYTEQRQIGTARALGYDRSEVLKHYLEYGAFIGIAGGVLGAAIGIALGKVMVDFYVRMLGMPAVQGSARLFDLIVAGIVVSTVLSILGAVMPARKSATISPAAAMRMDAGVTIPEPTASAASRAERGKLFPSWLRFPLRNLSRNRRRTALSAFALVLTLATLVSLTGAISSIQDLLAKQKKIMGWDVVAYLPVPQGASFLADASHIKGVVRAEPAIQSPARLTSAGKAVDVDFQAYGGDTKMHAWAREGSSTEKGPEGGVLLNRSIRRALPLSVGQQVVLQTAAGSARFRVDGFVKEPFGSGCYADLATVQKLLGSNAFNVVLLKTEPGATDSVATFLRHMPEVGNVNTKTGVFDTLGTTINKGIRPMFNVLLAMILGIGFAIVFTLVSITLLERRQEIATMLTIGWSALAVGRSFLVETGAIALGVLPFGIALGWGLCWVLINKVLSTTTTQLMPEMSFAAWPVAVICGAFLLLMALSVVPATRQLSKMDLATAARERTN